MRRSRARPASCDGRDVTRRTSVEPSFLSGDPVPVIETPAAAPPPPARAALPLPAPPNELRCATCEVAMTPNTSMVIRGQRICMLCASQVGAPIQNAQLSSHMPAALAGLVGALIGAAVFAIVG